MASANKKKFAKLSEANTKLRRTLLWIFFILMSIAIVMFNFWQPKIAMQVGDIATEDIFFEKDTATYTSEIRTAEAVNAAAAAVSPVYRIDNQSLNANLKIIAGHMASFEAFMFYNNPELEIEALPETDDEAQEGNTNQKENVNPENDDNNENNEATENVLPAAPLLTEEDLIKDAVNFMEYDILPKNILAEKRQNLAYVLALSKSEFNAAQKVLNNAITNVIQPGVTEDELVSAKALIESNIVKASVAEETIDFLLDVYALCDIEANKFYDAVATASEIEAAQQAVQPVSVTVLKGEKIVSRGTAVTELQIEALGALGLLKDNNVQILPYVGLLAMIVIFYILLIIYVRSYYPKSRVKEGNIILMGLIINFTLLLAKAFSMITIESTELSFQLGFLLPVAASSMLLAILIGQGVAIIISFFVAVFAGLLLDGGIYCTVVAMVGSVTGIFCSKGINQRGQFVSASFYLALANILSITALNLVTEQSYSSIAIGAGFGFINGLISAVLAMGILPFMESAFKITTSARLTELSNSNHPLLKRLMLEAPGTYHHSVMVGNLAETAADAIGADPLLVRVSAYYHDIGKLKRPYFFVENQQPGDNPHDKLQPSLSAMIITSHVKDGVDILKENRFPKEIIDAVLSHHGTSVLSFFYHKAVEIAEEPETVYKEDFSYRGKLPDTKELALVSLADAVQAAVQALQSNDVEAIEQRVRSVIKARIDEGQLSAAPLTFADIELITQNFVHVLAGMTHSRIEYPEQVAKELAEKSAKAAEAEEKK